MNVFILRIRDRHQVYAVPTTSPDLASVKSRIQRILRREIATTPADELDEFDFTLEICNAAGVVLDRMHLREATYLH
jgi:hypothetical protein